MRDIERKLYTIVYHMRNSKGRNASMSELVRFTGRDEGELIPVIETLVSRGLILWDENRTRNVALPPKKELYFSRMREQGAWD